MVRQEEQVYYKFWGLWTYILFIIFFYYNNRLYFYRQIAEISIIP